MTRALLLAAALSAVCLWSTSGAAQETATVFIDDDRLEPATITIRVGDTVRWLNIDHHSHAITFDPELVTDATSIVLPEGAEPFESGELPPDLAWSHTFQVPGHYQYVCRFHEREMRGEIVVEE